MKYLRASEAGRDEARCRFSLLENTADLSVKVRYERIADIRPISFIALSITAYS